MGLLFLALPLLGQGTSTSPNPTVTFSSPGIKQVTLTACNTDGCSSVTKAVTVLDPRPQIQGMGGIPSLAGMGQTFSFWAQAAGRPPLTYRWIITGGPTDVVLTGNPATWSTLQPGLGSFQVHLEVQNANGTAASALAGVTVKKMTFADIAPDFWAWANIESLYTYGITTGCAANPLRYCPGSTVTRAEMAVFLTRATRGLGFVAPQPTGVFADVDSSFWAAPQIEQFYADGITTGCAANPLRFCPSDNVTRAEMAVFLLRAKHGGSYTPPPATGTLFADVPGSYWAASWIEQLYSEGITTGCDSNPRRFCPDNTVTRDQMAAFLTRTFSLALP